MLDTCIVTDIDILNLITTGGKILSFPELLSFYGIENHVAINLHVTKSINLVTIGSEIVR